MRFFPSKATNILTQIFIIFGCLTSLSRGQDDCLGCILGEAAWNSFVFTGEKAIEGITFTLGVAKELWELRPGKVTTDPAQAFVNPLVDVPLLEPEGQPAGDPGTAPGTQTIPEDANPTTPDINLLVETPAFAPISTSEENKCDPENPGGPLRPNSCGIALAQIVWPPPCSNPAQTARILAALNALAPPESVRTFTNECGTFFWTAALTEQQIEDLMAANLGIQHIVRDGTAESNIRLSRIQKRALGNIMVDVQSSDNLAYYSTASGVPNLENHYIYWKLVGDGITAYWLDTEIIIAPDEEFTRFGVWKDVLYAEDIDPELVDAPNSGNHGECMLSLIGGRQYGVARKAVLKFVKVGYRDSSMLSGLRQIIADLEAREQRGEHVKGRTVVGTSNTHPRFPSRVNEGMAGVLIKRLIDEFQVVFVCAAGNINAKKGEVPYGEINMWPPSLAENDGLPIITVGAINMEDHQVFPWSKGASTVTVTAPGECVCKKGGGSSLSQGTSPASAMVVGAAVDILSRDYLRNYLGLNENEAENPSVSVAVKVRDYLVSKSFARTPGGQSSIWNGLYLNDRKRLEP